ncbi:MAG: Ig-like domain-containing protein [Chloroflexi bacterium]|nr:Ig-like domain-containing protein [Chloroflexota bacterium]
MRYIWLKLILIASFILPALLIWGTNPRANAASPAPIFQLGHKPAQLESRPSAAEFFANHQSEQAVVAPNCRYGISDTGGSSFFDQFGAGWVVNFVPSNNPSYAPGMEYVPIIRLKQLKDGNGNRLPGYTFHGGTPPLTDGPGGMGELVAAMPGRLWLVGNEIDRHTAQDDIMPEIYATAYHDIYYFIKQRDPSARIAISGLVQVSPGRLQYLDLVWESYLAQYGHPMPVDVWNMHAYALPEIQLNGQDSGAAVALGTDPNLALIDAGGQLALCAQNNVMCIYEHDQMAQLQYQVIAMRQWMKNRGQQNKPLIISEYSLLYPYIKFEDGTCDYVRDEYGNCFDPARVSQFMVNSFNYLETAADPNLGYALDNNKLVQQWLWFTSAVPDNEYVGSSSKLLTNNLTSLTTVGNTYASSVAARPQNVNLIIEQVNSPVANTTLPLSATVQLEVTIRNNGTKPTTQPTTLNFYDDTAALIGTAVIPAGLGGCAIESATAIVQWTDLAPGTYPFTVVLSSGEDSHAADNTGAGIVLVNPKQIYLPLTAASSSRGIVIISPP